MSNKPELSAASGLQNVVVYVSNENFAQAYAVAHQNVEHGSHIEMQGETFQQNVPPHSLASMVATSKSYHGRTQLVKHNEFTNPINVSQDGSYFGNNQHAVISQNGYPESIVNNLTSFQDISVDGSVVLNSNHEVVTGGRQAGPGRPEPAIFREECENRENVVDSSYTTAMGGESTPQSVRSESVRSDAAESSCSSLSSADDSVVKSESSDMIVFDGSVSARPGGIVLNVGPVNAPQAQHSAVPRAIQESVIVPFGWKRLLTSGIIVYIR